MVSFLPADTRNGARSTSEPTDTYRSLLNCFYYAHLLKSDISETINARGPAHFAVTASLLHKKRKGLLKEAKCLRGDEAVSAAS